MQIEPRELVDAARGAAEGRDFFVCEGIGGLLVPFTTGYMVRDLAIDLGSRRDRGEARPRHDQPHPAHDRGGPYRRPRRARGRAHALA